MAEKVVISKPFEMFDNLLSELLGIGLPYGGESIGWKREQITPTRVYYSTFPFDGNFKVGGFVIEQGTDTDTLLTKQPFCPARTDWIIPSGLSENHELLESKETQEKQIETQWKKNVDSVDKIVAQIFEEIDNLAPVANKAEPGSAQAQPVGRPTVESVSLQLAESGRPPDPAYDDAADRIKNGEPYRMVFSAFCESQNIAKPDKGLRDSFKAAMKRRGVN